MKIIEDAVAALPLVIRAAELAYPVSNRDTIDHLKRLDSGLSLTLQLTISSKRRYRRRGRIPLKTPCVISCG